MAEYIEREAFAEKIKRLIGAEWDSGTSWKRAYLEFIDMIDEQPTADVVEVVRCRDCRWWKSIFSWNGKEHKVCVRDAAEPPRESDDYCSYGERRENAT